MTEEKNGKKLDTKELVVHPDRLKEEERGFKLERTLLYGKTTGERRGALEIIKEKRPFMSTLNLVSSLRRYYRMDSDPEKRIDFIWAGIVLIPNLLNRAKKEKTRALDLFTAFNEMNNNWLEESLSFKKKDLMDSAYKIMIKSNNLDWSEFLIYCKDNDLNNYLESGKEDLLNNFFRRAEILKRGKTKNKREIEEKLFKQIRSIERILALRGGISLDNKRLRSFYDFISKENEVLIEVPTSRDPKKIIELAEKTMDF